MMYTPTGSEIIRDFTGIKVADLRRSIAQARLACLLIS